MQRLSVTTVALRCCMRRRAMASRSQRNECSAFLLFFVTKATDRSINLPLHCIDVPCDECGERRGSMKSVGMPSALLAAFLVMVFAVAPSARAATAQCPEREIVPIGDRCKAFKESLPHVNGERLALRSAVPPLLISQAGAGNTMTRMLIEYATGFRTGASIDRRALTPSTNAATTAFYNRSGPARLFLFASFVGSLYNDSSLMDTLPDEAACPINTLAAKSHLYVPPLPSGTSNVSIGTVQHLLSTGESVMKKAKVTACKGAMQV